MHTNDDGDDGNGGDSDGSSDGNGNDAAAAANSNNVDEDYSGDLRMAIGRWQFGNNDGTTMMYVNDDGNGGNGGDGDGNSDGNGNGDGDGDGNDATTAANGDNADEDSCGNLRTTIG